MWRSLGAVSRWALKTHLDIAHALEKEDWDNIDRVMAARIAYLQTHVAAKQRATFERLRGRWKTI